MDAGARRDDQQLLTEQITYYRAVSGEYFDHRIDEPGGDELAAAVEYSPTISAVHSSAPAASSAARLSAGAAGR